MTGALYESGAILDITGGVLRPGGVELTGRALEICGFNKGSRVLDLGCGSGITTALLEKSGLTSLSLDFSMSMLERAAASNQSLTAVQASATDLPFRNSSLDGVVSECVLSLTGDIPKTVAEISRILKSGGRIILSDIYSRSNSAPSPMLDVSCCFNGARPLAEIEKAITDSGLKIKIIEDHTPLLKQLAGQIIFSMGSLEKFWALFTGEDKAAGACNALKAMMPGYYLLIAEKG